MCSGSKLRVSGSSFFPLMAFDVTSAAVFLIISLIKATAIAEPTSNVKLNRYGNLAGGQGRIKRLLAKKNTFQGTIDGVAGRL